MYFVVLCPGAPEDSTGCGSGFKVSQKTGSRLKVLFDRLGEPGIELGTPGYNESDLFTTSRRLSLSLVQRVSYRHELHISNFN